MTSERYPGLDIEALERAAQVRRPYQPPQHLVIASRLLQTIVLLEILFVVLSYGTCFLGFDPSWLARTTPIPPRLCTLLIFGAPGLCVAVLAIFGIVLADSTRRRRWFVGACVLGAIWGLTGVFATIVDLL
jgi:hypothetical protein